MLALSARQIAASNRSVGILHGSTHPGCVQDRLGSSQREILPTPSGRGGNNAEVRSTPPCESHDFADETSRPDSPRRAFGRAARQHRTAPRSRAERSTRQGSRWAREIEKRRKQGFGSNFAWIGELFDGKLRYGWKRIRSGAADGSTKATPQLVVPRSIPMMYGKASYSISISAGASTLVS